MELKKENDLLEQTLAVAESGYAAAYRFLLDAYEREPESYGPQTLYFLSCLAGGSDRPAEALDWLRKSIAGHGWWYRPEVLEDDDLAPLKDDPDFCALRSVSDARYAAAAAQARPRLSWERKTAEGLLLAVHGNTQNAQTARADWTPAVGTDGRWQIETIQSGEPDGYGTYRWSYDMRAYLPVADAIGDMQKKGYRRLVCGGFSAGCDMLLRAAAFTPARCDMLILQNPWIPVLQDHAQTLTAALRQKGIALRILCGAEDEDCLPLAQQLYAAADRVGIDVELIVQENSRHQFPAEPYALEDL